MSKTEALVKATGIDVAELAAYKTQAVQLVEFLSTVVADTPEKEAWVSQQRRNVGALIKLLEDNRKALKAPLLEAGRRIDALFKPSTQPLVEAEGILIRLEKDAALLRDAAEREALKLAETAAAQGDDQGVMTALAQVPTAPAANIGGTTKLVWVPDKIDMEQLPRSYMVADVAKLEGVGRAAGEAEPVVAGVTWKREATYRRKS